MNMYSDFLKENGIEWGSSFAKEQGTGDAPFYPQYASEAEKAQLLEMERSYPEQKKKFTELQEWSKAEEKKKDVKDVLKLFVQMNYPKNSFRSDFQSIYDGWIHGMANTMYESAEFTLENGDIQIKGKQQAKEEPANELERMLQEAKINLDRSEPDINDILQNSFLNTMGHKFTGRELRKFTGSFNRKRGKR